MTKLTLHDLLMVLRHVLRTRRAEVDAIAAARGIAADLLDTTLARLEAIRPGSGQKGTLVRFSIGFEAVEDLIGDLAQALDSAFGPR